MAKKVFSALLESTVSCLTLIKWMPVALITLVVFVVAAVWRMLLQCFGGCRQVPTNCKIATATLGNLYPSAISSNSISPGAAMKKEDPDIKEEADGCDEGLTTDGPNIAASVSSPSANKQSALFRTPMRRWFPRDGDGDAQQPGSWQYVIDWDIDLNPIELLPKYTVLSNVVVWMVWTSEKFSAAEMATYWPLDFDVVEGHAVLLNTRRPRGRSKILNSKWAKLPVWKDLEVKLEPICPNNQWGKAGYDFDQRVAHTQVWDTATSITILSRASSIFNPSLVALMPPDRYLTLSETTSTLPEMDDNTLFLTWNTYPAPHPELSAAFSNNTRFLSEMEGVGCFGEEQVVFCKNVGSNYGAADVMIAPNLDPQRMVLSLDPLGESLTEMLEMALMACISRGKKKLVVGGLCAAPRDLLPVSVPWYGGDGVCPFKVTVFQRG
ncbi:hypothetical protein HDK64DRAFT_313517 [Phyllosticta capitalensis]